MTFRHFASFWTCIALGTGIALAGPKPPQVCKVKFSVAYLDGLNNMNYGIPTANIKDMQKKLSDFGDVCYTAEQKPDLIFFIHTTPAVYHGTHVHANNSSSAAPATSGDGAAAAAAAAGSSTTAVPHTVDYSVFILEIEIPEPNGTFKILRTLDQEGLYHTIYGIGHGKGKHPIPNVILAGAEWLHDEYLGNKSSGSKW